MDKNFRRQVMDVVRQMDKQMGADNPIARYITSAVIAKLCGDNLKTFLKNDDEEETE